MDHVDKWKIEYPNPLTEEEQRRIYNYMHPDQLLYPTELLTLDEIIERYAIDQETIDKIKEVQNGSR